MKIEPLALPDAVACAAIFALNRPEAAWSSAAIAARASDPPPARRLVARGGDGAVLGLAVLDVDLQTPGADRYQLELHVDPAACGHGVGRALAEASVAGLRVAQLRVGARHEHASATGWILAEGFREEQSHVFSRLDLRGELAPVPPLPDGVRLTTLAGARAELGPREAHLRLLKLILDFTRDLPGAEGAGAGVSVEVLERAIARPEIDPELYLLAAVADRFVAKSDLRLRDDPQVLDTGSTGVARTWRRKGLARSLKLAVLHAAGANGALDVWTANAAENQPMRALNEQLGFQVALDYRTYVR